MSSLAHRWIETHYPQANSTERVMLIEAYYAGVTQGIDRIEQTLTPLYRGPRVDGTAECPDQLRGILQADEPVYDESGLVVAGVRRLR